MIEKPPVGTARRKSRYLHERNGIPASATNASKKCKVLKFKLCRLGELSRVIFLMLAQKGNLLPTSERIFPTYQITMFSGGQAP